MPTHPEGNEHLQVILERRRATSTPPGADRRIWRKRVGFRQTCVGALVGAASMTGGVKETALVVSLDVIGRLPLRMVVPITDWKPYYAGYPWFVAIPADPANGLTKDSGADTFQTKSVSLTRLGARPRGGKRVVRPPLGHP